MNKETIISFVGKNKKMMLITILVILAIVFSFLIGTERPNSDVISQLQEQMQKQYAPKIIALEKENEQIKKELRSSKLRYDILTKKIKEKRDAKNDIKPPETVADTVQRFNSLGYKPTIE